MVDVLPEIVIKCQTNRKALTALTFSHRHLESFGRDDSVVPLEMAELATECRPLNGWRQLPVRIGVERIDGVKEQSNAYLSIAQAQAPVDEKGQRPSSHSPEQGKTHRLTIIPSAVVERHVGKNQMQAIVSSSKGGSHA